MATLTSATFVAVGLDAVVSRRYDGYSSRTGAHVHLVGTPAVLLGFAIAALGLLPLALWARTGRGAALWGTGSALLMAGLLVASILAR